MSRRLLVVGTDTAVGKTAISCALLRAAAHRHVTAVPFKPAASAVPGEPLDAERLLSACSLPLSLEAICPFRYDRPLAPGIAHRAQDFLGPPVADPHAPLASARSALESLEAAHDPTLTVIEAAGGLHVPMPGGLWQVDWLRELGRHALVVGRLGLGTLNHTRLTIDALRRGEIVPLGFVLVPTHPPDSDPSAEYNADVLSRATGCQHLGTTPYTPYAPDDTHEWVTDAVWELLRS